MEIIFYIALAFMVGYLAGKARESDKRDKREARMREERKKRQE